eukprot:c36176_g1_i1.p1 GENE.c36176_g1_i1~~c36176_g1_i1.p1  ORF type:complete len:205 (+),score=67.90 c36176_g1_i1:109-723(+)
MAHWILVVLFFYFITTVFLRIKSKNKRNEKEYKILVVLGSGGHTTEMLGLVNGIFKNIQKKINFTFVIASSDQTSLPKLRSRNEFSDSPVLKLPRSREVHQSYFTSIFTTLNATLFAFKICFSENPNIIISNGPGTCIPIIISSKILQVLTMTQTKIVYVESFARTKTLSLSGKIAYKIVDKFIVQWKTRLPKYPKAIYLGNLI